jgi:7-cyano-7-deazaguanine synthase
MKPYYQDRTAVLSSGGLDSAVLVASEARARSVLPIYVSNGLAWEDGERDILERLLRTPPFRDRVEPIVWLQMTVADIYSASHWALRGTPPAYDTPDEDVYLVGRNLMLLSKAGVLCAIRKIGRIALGPLAGNPFPDATTQFFDAMARAMSLGLAHTIEVVTPFAALHKADVIRLGAELDVPFELTLSCMNPTRGLHCGLCSKCRERRDAFHDAGVADPTEYAAVSPR